MSKRKCGGVSIGRLEELVRCGPAHLPEGAPKDILAWPSGEPVVVMRPLRPEVTVHVASLALQHQDVNMLAEAHEGKGAFMGFLAKRGGKNVIVFEGEEPISLEPGDLLTELGAIYKPD